MLIDALCNVFQIDLLSFLKRNMANYCIYIQEITLWMISSLMSAANKFLVRSNLSLTLCLQHNFSLPYFTHQPTQAQKNLIFVLHYPHELPGCQNLRHSLSSKFKPCMAKRTYTGYQPVSKRNANDMVDICYVTTLNVLSFQRNLETLIALF